MYADRATGYGQMQGQPMQAMHGITGAVAPETRPSEVSEEMAHLSRVIDHLGMTTTSLSNRLSCVRRATGAGLSGNKAGPPEPVLCELASNIRGQRKTIEQHHAELLAMLSELEV